MIFETCGAGQVPQQLIRRTIHLLVVTIGTCRRRPRHLDVGTEAAQQIHLAIVAMANLLQLLDRTAVAVRTGSHLLRTGVSVVVITDSLHQGLVMTTGLHLEALLAPHILPEEATGMHHLRQCALVHSLGRRTSPRHRHTNRQHPRTNPPLRLISPPRHHFNLLQRMEATEVAMAVAEVLTAEGMAQCNTSESIDNQALRSGRLSPHWRQKM